MKKTLILTALSSSENGIIFQKTLTNLMLVMSSSQSMRIVVHWQF